MKFGNRVFIFLVTASLCQFAKPAWATDPKKNTYSNQKVVNLEKISDSKPFESQDNMGVKSVMLKKRPAAKRQGRRGPGFFDIETMERNLDLYFGGCYNFASGDYFNYQQQYYETGSPTFKGSGEFSNFFWYNFGLQGRYFPRLKDLGIMSQLSVAFGLMYLRKGFSHDVNFQNTSLKYDDITSIKESYSANFVGTQLTARFGRRIFVEGGISLDWFLNGLKTFELKREATNSTDVPTDTVIFGEYATGNIIKSTLTRKTMATVGFGWVFGAGFQITPFAGVRFYNTVSSTFFKDGDKLKNFQPSLQVVFTIN